MFIIQKENFYAILQQNMGVRLFLRHAPHFVRFRFVHTVVGLRLPLHVSIAEFTVNILKQSKWAGLDIFGDGKYFSIHLDNFPVLHI